MTKAVAGSRWAKHLRFSREEAGLSQSALARAAGVNSSYVSRLENRERPKSSVSLSILEALVTVLEQQLGHRPELADELYWDAGYVPPDLAEYDPLVCRLARALQKVPLSAGEPAPLRMALYGILDVIEGRGD